jgi:hypothetical protein
MNIAVGATDGGARRTVACCPPVLPISIKMHCQVNPVEAGRQSSGNLPAIRMAAMSE